MNMDNIWRRAEKDMARRERRRLIRARVITPASFMRPQLMVRNPDAPENPAKPWTAGGWSPSIGGN